MVELADTLVSKISAGNGVWVQVPLEARSICSSTVYSDYKADRPPSSSGLGYCPFKAAARVQIPLGVQVATSESVQLGLLSRDYSE